MMRTGWWLWASAFGLLAGPILAHAEGNLRLPEWSLLADFWPHFDEIDYAVGMALTSRPRYPGARQQKLEPRLLGSLEWGPLSLSGVRGGGLLRPSRTDAPATGLSARLLRVESLETSLGLRLDNGRDAFSHPELGELAAIPRHVRYVLTASYGLSSEHSALFNYSGAFQPQRHGHTASMGWSFSPSSVGRMSLQSNLSLTWVDSTYMRARFGLPHQTTSLAYEPGAGLRDVSFSLSLRYRLSPRWSVLAGATVARYLGDAARSPILESRQQISAQLGLMYQSRAERS